MMTPMTERGLPSVDGAPACPFVAFDDDRDTRATGPDHRHRCYAEVRPAPRALAHQQAYCLSSAFAVCPTFQDWARREAAQALSASALSASDAAAAGASASASPVGKAPPGDPGALDSFAAVPGASRNPPRDWASPPPWSGTSQQLFPDEAADPDEPPEVQAIPPRGGGLSGSFADRLTAATPAPTSTSQAGSPAWQAPARPETAAPPEPAHDRYSEAEDDAYDDRRPDADPHRRPGGRRPRPSDRGPAGRGAPSWERIPRREAYPTLKTRMGLSGVSMPPILLGVIALIIAVPALFFLPALLGVGNPQATPGTNPSAGASDAAASATPAGPTAVPEPTAQIYVVQAGDTMSRIADRFGVPLQTLIDVNRATIPNPDVLTIGQEVIIPAVTPTLVPDAGGSPVPAASTSP